MLGLSLEEQKRKTSKLQRHLRDLKGKTIKLEQHVCKMEAALDVTRFELGDVLETGEQKRTGPYHYEIVEDSLKERAAH